MNTSTACAAIKTDTVEIITVIKNTAGYDLLSALTARAVSEHPRLTNRQPCDAVRAAIWEMRFAWDIGRRPLFDYPLNSSAVAILVATVTLP